MILIIRNKDEYRRLAEYCMPAWCKCKPNVGKNKCDRCGKKLVPADKLDLLWMYS